RRETDPGRRREYADALTRVYRKPSRPWVYWGFRPPPRPAHTVAWERTTEIEQALDRVLAAPDPTVRMATLRRMLREKVPARTATLARWLEDERDAERVAALLAALRDRPAAETRPHLEGVVRDRRHSTANRLLAAAAFFQRLDAKSEG